MLSQRRQQIGRIAHLRGGQGFFVRADGDELRELVALADQGVLRLDISERVPLEALPGVHARSDAGELRAKVVVVPPVD